MRRAEFWTVVAVLGGFASLYVVAVPPSASVLLPALALQLRAVRHRAPGVWLPFAQAGLTFAATIGFGTSPGVLGFLGGSLLLTRLWPLAPAAVIAPLFIATEKAADLMITVALMSMVIYGLTRLAQLADDARQARLERAMAAVADERLRLSTELSEGLGNGLTAIERGTRLALTGAVADAELLGEVTETARRSLAEAREAAAGYRAMSLGPEMTTARSMFSAADIAVQVRIGHTEPLGSAGALLAAVLREAATSVVRLGAARTCTIETSEGMGAIHLVITDDGSRTADDDDLGDLPERLREAGGDVRIGITPEGRHVVEAHVPAPPAVARPADEDTGYRLAVGLFVTVLIGFCVKALLGIPLALIPVALAIQAVIVYLQVSSVKGRHMGRLAVMAGLTYAPIPFVGSTWLGVAGFLAGPMLLAFPARFAWPMVVGVMATVAWIGSALDLPPAVTVNYTVSTLVTGLVVFGLLRLAQLVKELRLAREDLARSAVVEERLRASRDLHDLLGHSLAAILLKCELARRLEPDRARAELEEVLAMTRLAEADMRAVSGGAAEMSLTAEAESARSVLAAADVRVTLDLAHSSLPTEVETTMSVVLREAVTNVLRHSKATSCTISTEADSEGVRLLVRNDGAASSLGVRRGSSGIGNLTTRLAALDGTLTTIVKGDEFQVEARAPARTRDVLG